MDMITKKRFIFILASAVLTLHPAALYAGNSSDLTPDRKIAVLLVNHGSRSATWRNALLELEKDVTPRLTETGVIGRVTTAFMEYTEPSIATRLRELDANGYTDVVLVPVFLTVSSHSFDDIPTIIGRKDDPHSLESLKIEKIERYTPKARVHITAMLDFGNLLKENILRRVKKLSTSPSSEGLVMIAYGDETYRKDWSRMLRSVGEHIKARAGIDAYSFGWCGHLVHYEPDSTTVAIQEVLAKRQTALVVPVLVAHDEMFQVRIIGDGIDRIPDHASRVRYKPDSILPDPRISRWVVDAVSEQLRGLLTVR
jgi:hypothetical protein